MVVTPEVLGKLGVPFLVVQKPLNGRGEGWQVVDVLPAIRPVVGECLVDGGDLHHQVQHRQEEVLHVVVVDVVPTVHRERFGAGLKSLDVQASNSELVVTSP